MKKVFSFLLIVSMGLGLTAYECGSPEKTSGKLYLKQERFDKAIEAFEEAVKKNPADAEALYYLGYLYGNEKKDYDKMLDYFEKSLAAGEQFKKDISDQILYQWGTNFNKGASYFNKANKTQNPDSIKMFFDSAIEAFQNAVKIQPDSIAGYQNLIVAYLNSDQRDKAKEPLQYLIEKEKNADAYARLGDIYFLEGKEYWDNYKSSGNAQDSVKAYEKYNQVIDLLQEGLKEHPGNNDIIINQTNAYIAMNQSDRAINNFKTLVKADPENKYIKFSYGVALLRLKEYESAIEQFKGALDLDSEFEDARYNLAVAYVNWGSLLRTEAEAAQSGSKEYQEKFKAAIPYLEGYLDNNPDEAQVWDLLGRVYTNIGENDKATKAFDKADQLR